MEILKTSQPISWLDGVDLNGNVIQKDHELNGQNIAGKELHIPGSIGSTVGSYKIYSLAKRGFAPKKIIIENKDDAITIWGAIFGKIPFEISGWKPQKVDIDKIEKLNLSEEIKEKLVKIAELYETDEFIETKNLPKQISGVSYKTITDAGLNLIEDLAEDFRVNQLSMLNPAGMDLTRWREQRVPKDFAEKQIRIIKAYEKMGAMITCTCTPYHLPRIYSLISRLKSFGNVNLHWAESSAVVYANSVLGLRTNREGLSALFYAIAGFAPVYGLHLDENRNPNIKIKVEANLKTINDFATFGYWLGEKIKDKIPYISGIKKSSPSLNFRSLYHGIAEIPFLERLKALGAAGAASGSLALFHVEGITPEAVRKSIFLDRIEDTLFFEEIDLKSTKEKLNTGEEKDVDLVAFGCPHSSLDEIKTISKYLFGKKIRDGVDLWVCTSRDVKMQADNLGYTLTIEDAGGKVFCDTCMIVAPIEDIGYKTTATNSAKAAYYLTRFCKQKVVYGDVKEIIKLVVK
ncbi:MAG: aconitase X [Candidatus Aenigmatarchaeota archaeon]